MAIRVTAGLVLCVGLLLVRQPCAAGGAPSGQPFQHLQEQVNQLEEQMDQAQEQDTMLQEQLTAETAARIAGDQAEHQHHMEADAAEAAARQAADTVLQSSIDGEMAARLSADTTLQSNIDAEQAARIAGDAALQAQLDDLEARVPGTSYLSIGQIAFQPSEARQYQLGFITVGAFSEHSASLVAPVNLPHGSVVKQFTCYYYDTSVAADLKCGMRMIRFETGTWSNIGGTQSETDAGAVERSCCTGLAAEVDNTTHNYFVEVTPEPLVPGWDTGSEGPDLGIKGVVIRYDLPTP
ncbi:MAG: hypothetical protein H6Q33_5516 [Deltaproteobacteria bacterium]|jgi:hypothetical protein|nr:hypothetical protein [Deltaproteobacteria bacterium]